MRRRGAVLALALLAAGCAVNPVTGEKELVLISPEDELALGDAMHPGVIYDYDGEYHDPELKRYLGTIVLRLHRVSHRAGMPVDFKILNASLFNAFALPGHVYVTRGAVAKMRNEAEFAAVMGHEMAHVTARHAAKQLTTGKIARLGLGLLGAALPEDARTTDLVTGLGGVGLKLARLHYGRSQEEQADRVGTYYLYRAGYDPTRMVDMQELLRSLGGGGGGSFLARYFSTHPTAETRVRRVREVIRAEHLDDGRRQQGDGTFAARWARRVAPLRKMQKVYDGFDRARALAGKRRYAEALELLARAVARAPDQAPFHRLRGDILLRMDRPEQARAAYRRALALDRRYLPAAAGLGAASLKLRDYRAAEQHFRTCLRLLPGDIDARYGLGLAAFRTERYGDAARNLEAVVEHVEHPAALSYLGRSYEKLGRLGAAIDAYRRCVEAGTGTWRDAEPVRIARERLARLQSAGAVRASRGGDRPVPLRPRLAPPAAPGAA